MFLYVPHFYHKSLDFVTGEQSSFYQEGHFGVDVGGCVFVGEGRGAMKGLFC